MGVCDRLIKLIKDNKLFASGESFNLKSFEQRLAQRGLLPTFNAMYREDTNCTSCWVMFDFSDRFARFAHVLCERGYCSKMKSGTYYKK